MILVAATNAPAGEGFLSKIPEPGTWVKYHRTQKNSTGGQVRREFSGTVTVRFLDAVTEGTVHCRWVEFDLELIEQSNNQRSREIEKYLVPVSALAAEMDPAPNVVRGWTKYGDKETKPTKTLPDFLTAVYLSPPFVEPKTQSVRRTFDYQRGQLISLEQVSGRTTTNAGKSKTVLIRHEINLQKDVPNGAAGVRHEIEIRFKDSGGLDQSVIMDHNVVDFGTGAVSSLPENN